MAAVSLISPTYFNPNQQRTFQNTETNLKNYISQTFLAGEQPNDIRAARILLDTLELWDERGKSIKENFFLTLLKSHPENELIQKIHDLLFSDLKNIFFQCAATQKKEYYSAKELIEMINTFHQILSQLPDTYPPFTYLPSYNEGGKEILLTALKTPKDLVNILQKGFISSDSAFNAAPPLNLKALLSKNLQFNQFKKECIRYLASLGENNRLKIEVYLKFFKSLHENQKLPSLEKTEILKLVLLTTTSETAAIKYKYTIDDLEELVSEGQNLHEYGEEQLLYFSSAPDLVKGANLDEVILAIRYLSIGYRDTSNFDTVQNTLLLFNSGEITFSAFLKAVESLVPYQIGDEIEDKISIDSLMDRFSGKVKDPNVQFPLPPADLLKVKNQYLVVQKYCQKWKKLRMGDLVNKAIAIYAKAESGTIIEKDILKLYAIGRLAIRAKFKIYLYNTQVCTDLALDLLYPEGLLGQAKTGEGKSFVGGLLSFVRALSRPRQGHIISSDRKLATRDQGYFQEFFQTFNISTAHISEDNRDAKHFQARLLYGTATDFEFALMREMLYRTKLFPDPIKPGGKRFSWVLVDEVDNLTIDTSRNGARLAFQAEVTYDWVYVPIFNFVKLHFANGDSPISPSEILPKLKIYLKSYNNSAYVKYVDSLTDKKLIGWIQSARQALYKRTLKKEYVIGLKQSHTGEMVKGILIVDAENTGRIMHGSRWTNGIHEFVEVKEDLDVETESICPITMSHPILYSMYETLNGISGTIGNEFDREGLFSVYGIRSFDVPTHNPPKRVDLPTVIFETDREYYDAIAQLHIDCKNRGQPILNLNKTIQDTEALADLFKARNIPFELLNEVQKKDEDSIISVAGLPGASTIATNTATRGTDIKLTPISIANGGLYVVITFEADNIRIEMQGRGRSGRQGQPGTSVVYLSKEKLAKEYPEVAKMSKAQILEFLKEKRKEKAMVQKDTQLSYAKLERYTFEFVKIFYQALNQFHDLAEKDSFNEMIASYLNGRKLRKPPSKDYSKLSSKNQQIANEALKLLTNYKDDCMLSWKVLVTKIKERIHNTLINEFALNFQAQTSDMITESGLTSFSERHNTFKKFMQNLFLAMNNKELSNEVDEQFKKLAEKDLNDIKTTIKEIFEKNMTIWADYLDTSGRGIIKYLSEITQFDLNPFDNDNRIPPAKQKSTNKGSLDFYHDHEFRPLSGTRSDPIVGEPFKFGTPATGGLPPKYDPLESKEGSFYFSNLRPSNSWFDIGNVEIELPPYVTGNPLPAPAAAGSRVQLINYGNTCWLNSILKFIASTNFYDDMLKNEVKEKRLQGFIRTIIISIRTDKPIDDLFFKAFLNELKKVMPDIPIGRQNDAPEFLIRLCRVLEWKPAHANKIETETFNKLEIYPRLVMTYQPTAPMPAGWTKHPAVDNFKPEIIVTIPNNYGHGELDLAVLINEAGKRSIRPDRLIPGVPEVAEMEFLTTSRFMSLPNVMMVYIKRFTSDGHQANQIPNPIKLNGQNLIGFKHHEVTYKETNGMTHPHQIIPKEIRYYRIGAAVVHMGGLGGGHYICLERAQNGAMVIHNDNIITLSNSANFGVDGYFIRLDRVG